MEKKFYLVFVLLMTFVFLLAACTRDGMGPHMSSDMGPHMAPTESAAS